MSLQTRSKIWEYYEINAADERRANCLVCKEQLKRGGNDPRSFGTTGLINHLRSKHHAEYEKYSGINEAAKKRKLEDEKQYEKQSYDKNEKQSSDKKHQCELWIKCSKRKKPFDPSHPRQIAITRKIGEMIASDLLPFNVVSREGFIRLLHELEPLYVMPSARYFSRTLIPDMYVAVKSKIKKLLDTAACMSFTSNIWTSDSNVSAYLSLTAHWIDTDWNRMSVVLSLRNLEDSQLISSNILDMLDAWEIPDGKRGVLVRDNGASMVEAAQLTGMDHLGCYIHTIQLVVNRGLEVHTTVIDAIATARTLVGRFRHSTQATEQWNKIERSFHVNQADTTHRLIQDVNTRWNSTFYMLEYLIEQRRAITIYCQDNAGVKNLTPDEWTLIEHVLTTLRPFEEETRNAALPTGTVGMIIPSVKVLKLTLTKPKKADDDLGIQTMRADMLNDMETLFSDIESNRICALATVLDPTFKTIFFSGASQDRVKQMLLDEMVWEANKNDTFVRQSPTAAAIAPVSLDSEPKPSTSLDAFYQEMFDISFADPKPEPAFDCTELMCQQQMHAYLAEARQPRTTPPTDPIVYWKSREHTYPLLATLAKRFFATPPAIVDSERMFSASGVICSEGQSQMTASETEMLLFLQKNLTVTNYQY